MTLSDLERQEVSRADKKPSFFTFLVFKVFFSGVLNIFLNLQMPDTKLRPTSKDSAICEWLQIAIHI